MKKFLLILAFLLESLGGAVVWAQAAKHPPLSEYLMPADAEIALARSAAPANISDRATIKVLTASGFQVARQGENGFVCMVMRGWSAPTYTPAQFRDLVYDQRSAHPSVSTRWHHVTYCPTTSCAASLEWRAKLQSRSPKVFRQPM